MIDAALSVARLAQFASTLVLFGCGLFVLYAGEAQAIGTQALRLASLRSLIAIASAVGVAAALAGLAAESASITGAWTSVIAVVTGTRFGLIIALRAGALALLLATSRALQTATSLAVLASVLGGIVVASFAWTGHGSVGEGRAASLHLAADSLHLLAAGVWLGALVFLSVHILRAWRTRTVEEARRLLERLTRFSAIGPGVVAILILTGLINAYDLIGPSHWMALLETPYGLLLLVKVALFLLMLALAAVHRLQLVPRLRSAVTGSAALDPILRRLRTSLLAESSCAFLVLAAVAVLGMLEPPI